MASFGFRVDAVNPGHIYLAVFAGPDEQHRARVGSLTFRRDEWPEFKAILDRGDNDLAVEYLTPEFVALEGGLR